MELHCERVMRWITETGGSVVVRQVDDEHPTITLNGFSVGTPVCLHSATHAQDIADALEAAAHTALTWEEESTDGSWSFCYVPPTAGEGAP
jgi:hypothetical protein